MSHDIEFFNQKDFEYLKKYSMQKRDTNSPEQEIAYRHLQETYLKVEYWVKKTKEILFPNGYIHIRKSPVSQGLHFMDYLWGKIYPYPKEKSDKRLAYTLVIVDTNQFQIKIDVIGTLDNDDPIRKGYLNYYKKIENSSPRVSLFPADSFKDWDHLFEVTIKELERRKNDYERLHDGLFVTKNLVVRDEQSQSQENLSENNFQENEGNQHNTQKYQEVISNLYSDKITENDDDKLGIESEVESLAKVLAYKKTSLPLSIGLFGNWGSGKSFFMKKLEEKVIDLSGTIDNSKYHKKIAQIKFNAWNFVDANLWASLVHHIFSNIIIKGDPVDNIKERRNFLIKQIESEKHGISALESEIKKYGEKSDQLEAKLNSEKVQYKLAFKEVVLRKVDEKIKNSIPTAQIKKWLLKAGIDYDKKLPVEDQIHLLYSETSILKKEENKKKINDNVKLYSYSALIIIILIMFGVIGYIGYFIYFHTSFGKTIQNYTEDITGKLITFIGMLVTSFASAYPLYKPLQMYWDKYFNWFPEFIEKIKSIAPELQAEIEKQEEALKEKLDEFKNKKSELDERKTKAENEVKKLEEDLEKTTHGDVLANFIKERVGSDDYSKLLGIQTKVSSDFKRLSDLIIKYNNSLEVNAKTYEREFMINRIILYIDDLDRCPYNKVVQVLEAVHLLLAFDAFIVVVAVDERWVSNALKVKYKEFFNENSRGATPQDFLEKIFQIPYWVKPMDTRGKINLLDHLMRSEIQVQNISTNNIDYSEEENLEDEHKFDESKNNSSNESPHEVELSFTQNEKNFIPQIEGLMGSTPRSIKRFVNIYQLIKAGLSKEEFEIFESDSFLIRNITRKESVEGKLYNYECAMFLLAIVIGMPKSGIYFFKYLRDIKYKEMTFLEGLDKFIEEQLELSKGKIDISPIQKEVDIFKHWINKTTRKLELRNLDAGQLQFWDSYVSRYSFDSEVHRSET